MLALMVMGSVSAADLVKRDGEIRWALRSEPLRVREGDRVRYTIRVSSEAGRPVAGADLRLIGTMPDGMAVRAAGVRTAEAGVYQATVLFPMAGAWRMELSMRGETKTGTLVFTEIVRAR